MNFYLFNPDHDLALANGTATFVPPFAVRQMAADLSLLPIWYAGKNSVVLSDNVVAAPFVEFVKSIIPSFTDRSVSVITSDSISSLSFSSQTQISPWGWDLPVRSYLHRLGIPSYLLPSDECMAQIRYLSNRQRAVEMLPKLKLNTSYIGESYYLTDVWSCIEFAKNHSECVFKAPISGSGKGLNWYREGIFTSPFERWCRRQLSMQGGIIAEPVYSKVADFAMEFYIDEQGVALFVGYSFFKTTKTGVYTCNLLVEDDYPFVSNCCMKLITNELRPILLKEIEQMFGKYYRGYLGVDMMICKGKAEDSFLIHPCVEINTRTTMGVLSRIFYNQYVYMGRQGTFNIEYYKKEGEALRLHLDNERNRPLQLKDGKIYEGYLPLTPVNTQTHFRTWVDMASL